MPINIQDYLLGRIPVGRKVDIPAYLMAKAASGGGIQEITGALPLYVRSRASQILKNYIIYGTASGAGVETENLFDYTAKDTENGFEIYKFIRVDGSIGDSGNHYVSEYIEIEPNTVYSLCQPRAQPIVSMCFYNSEKSVISTKAEKNAITTVVSPISAKYVRLTIIRFYQADIMFIEGSTLPDHYIPHGYKLPLKVTSNGTTTNYPIYIGDSKLGEEEYVDYEEQKVYKLVDGVLTPTDPPVPLPDIALPQDIAAIDTEEEFKYNSTVKGRINPVHYAYSINADTAEITYLADNEDFTPAAMGDTGFDYGSWENAFFMPRPCMLKSDGTVDYYLDPNDYSKKLDGTASDIADPTYDGNVMLEFPKIWYKFVPTGDDGEGGTFHCSNAKLDDDYECWCNYDANNNEIDHFYVAAYNGIILDGKMRSLSGYALTQENGADTTTGQAEIAAARANNQNGIDEWYTYLISDHQLLTYLATLICKHVNHQATFGRGIDSGSTAAKRAYVTGTLNDKGLFWGDTSTGTRAVKIFGIENFYACVWKRAAGLIGIPTGYVYKLTHGTKDGSTATSFNTNGSGYKTIARTKPANGEVTTMHYEPNGFWIPATTGTNRYNDYHWTGSGYVLIGGGSGSGSTSGSWFVGLNHGVSNSVWTISSALSCKPRALASGT